MAYSVCSQASYSSEGHNIWEATKAEHTDSWQDRGKLQDASDRPDSNVRGAETRAAQSGGRTVAPQPHKTPDLQNAGVFTAGQLKACSNKGRACSQGCRGPEASQQSLTRRQDAVQQGGHPTHLVYAKLTGGGHVERLRPVPG